MEIASSSIKSRKVYPHQTYRTNFYTFHERVAKKSSAIDLITFSSSNNDYKGTITGNHGIHLKMPTLKEQE